MPNNRVEKEVWATQISYQYPMQAHTCFLALPFCPSMDEMQEGGQGKLPPRLCPLQAG